MITNQETILQAYISISRHIRKRFATQMCARPMVWETLNEYRISKNENLGSSVHRANKKRLRKRQTRIMFERYYSFLHHCLLSWGYVMLQKKYFEQRWSRRHKARGQGQGHKKIRGQGHKKIRSQGQPFRGQTLSRPRTGMLEAKDQGHKRKCSPKKRSSK